MKYRVRSKTTGRKMTVLTESSSVTAYGYNLISSELYVVYTNGREYTYSGVPPWVYRGLATAASKGKYIARVVKQYDCIEGIEAKEPSRLARILNVFRRAK